jgi:class 3 adenylate cyclase/predicted ATPase
MECGTKVAEAASGTSRVEMVVPNLEDMQDRLYIPEPIKRRMDAAERDIVGENRLVTAVFADISGFTPMSESLDAEAVVERVNQCFQAVTDAVYRYEGSVNRFIGDCVLAFFGAPLAHENDPERAILAALDMREAVSQLDLNISVGINTGMMYFGPVGTQEHLEISAYGQDINLAKRLQETAQPGQILAGEGTYRFTRRAFEFARLERLTLKGITEPVSAYAALKPLPRPEKIRGIEGLRAELIGRDDELTKLKDALSDVLQGHGQMVSLIGEAGVGKSRLVAELKEFALAPSSPGSLTPSPFPLWLEGRCLSLGVTAGYWPFIDIFRDYFGWGSDESDRSRGERIVERLGELVTQGDLSKARLEEIGPLLGHLLSVQFGNDWDEQLSDASPEQIKRRTFMAIRDIFLALCKRQPVVLVLEDLHWADSLSLDLISLLMETLTLAPLLLLCVYRPEHEHKSWHLATIASQKCPERYTEIHLRELTPQQGRRLVESLLTIDRLPASVKELILEKSQGNPFFVEEVIRSLINAGMIYQEGDMWRALEGIESVTVPESIQSVILSRIDRLEQELRYVLQSASVIGRLFRRRLLKRVTQQETELERDLWQLEDHELIYQERTIPEEEYSFYHVLTQETVYQNILARRRASFHQQVAAAMEILYQDALDEYYEQLAYHYDKGGDVQKAIEYLFKAGEKAKRSYANEEAIAHLTRGLELLETLPETAGRNRRELDFQIALGVPLVLTKGHSAPEVEKTYTRARELCEQVGEASQLFQVLLGLRRFYFVRGELQTAHELGEQLVSVAQSLQDPAHLSRAHMMLGETSYWLGQFAQVREHSEQGISLYDLRQSRSSLLLYGNDTGVGCQIFKAWALWHIGYPDQALDIVHEGLIHAQELAHPFNVVFALHYAATVHQFRREAQAAQEHTEEVIRISTEYGFTLYSAWGTVMQGWALAELGEANEGIAQMREGIAAWRAMGGQMSLPYCLALLAEAYGKAGQAEEGLSTLAEALTVVDRTGERTWEPELFRLKGELLLMQGADEAEVETCFQQAIDVARRQSSKSLELRAATSLSRLWQKQGKKKEARELLQEIYGWFTEGFGTADLKEAKALLDGL